MPLIWNDLTKEELSDDTVVINAYKARLRLNFIIQNIVNETKNPYQQFLDSVSTKITSKEEYSISLNQEIQNVTQISNSLESILNSLLTNNESFKIEEQKFIENEISKIQHYLKFIKHN